MAHDIQKWIDTIKPDMINLFFERMLSDCGNSIFEMEKRIKNYALSSIPFVDDGKEINQLEYEIMELYDSLELKTNTIKILKKENNQITSDYEKFRKLSIKHEKERNEYIRNLKRNSVVFSMDDV